LNELALSVLASLVPAALVLALAWALAQVD